MNEPFFGVLPRTTPAPVVEVTIFDRLCATCSELDCLIHAGNWVGNPAAGEHIFDFTTGSTR